MCPPYLIYDEADRTRVRKCAEEPAQLAPYTDASRPRIPHYGYLFVYCPDHPKCTKRGLVLEHRLVMEISLGRFLRKGEVVHHIDGDRLNNSRKNLRLFASQAEHSSHHRIGCPSKDPFVVSEVTKASLLGLETKDQVARRLGFSVGLISLIQKAHKLKWNQGFVTEDMVRKALQEHGGNEVRAALSLGMRPRSLYHSFRHILPRRRSPRYLDFLWSSVREAIRAGHTNRAIAAHIGVNESALERRRGQDEELRDLKSQYGPRPKGVELRSIHEILSSEKLAQAAAL